MELPAHSKVRAAATPAPAVTAPAPGLCPRRGQVPPAPRSVPCGLVDIEVELPAHIEAEAVAVARLVVEVYRRRRGQG